MPKWYDLAEKSLGEKDEIQKTYQGKFDGDNGYMILSNDKLLFVKEEGFIFKNHDVTMELPYDRIGKIYCEDRYNMDLTDIEGRKHEFQTYQMPVSIIKDSVNELRSPEAPNT